MTLDLIIHTTHQPSINHSRTILLWLAPQKHRDMLRSLTAGLVVSEKYFEKRLISWGPGALNL
ncbi:MAG: hypothetical protein IKA34_12080 [Bacteroidales bacterium]|nr:hypothetical protein [Bacteroidales bacterium]